MKKNPTNKEIAQRLRYIAAAYTLKGESRFRIIAYERAADAVEHASVEMKDVWEAGKLRDVDGIGASIASHLDEWFRTGRVKHFDQVTKGLPESMFPLLNVPGFGPKRAFKLVTALKLTSAKTVIDDLQKAGKQGKIALIEGFGERSEQDILERLEDFKKGRVKTDRMILPYAYQLATKILDHLNRSPDVEQAEPLGSLRRMAATVGDIDIAVASVNAEAVIDHFIAYHGVERVIEKGPTTASILVAGGKQIDLMVQPPRRFGALLQHFTGSKQHNIHLRELALKKGLSLSEYGIRKQKTGSLREFATEESFYRALGLEWIPPELREDQGEIEAALRQAKGKRGGLPKLVELKDIKGDLHIHSNYDLEPSHDLGTNSLEDIVYQAKKFGYQYVGISDHNPSISNHNKRQVIDIMKRRKEHFEKIMSSIKSTRVQIFIMLEIDILPDGKLALPQEGFSYIDAGIASIHSSFNQPRKQMTKRILRALKQPKVRIFAHPTSRLLLQREGIDLDWEELFSFCQSNSKALEINSWPQRLDLPDRLIHDAIKAGVKLVINTDSHRTDQMINMRFGVATARRGWATPRDVVNSLSFKEFRSWLQNEL